MPNMNKPYRAAEPLVGVPATDADQLAKIKRRKAWRSRQYDFVGKLTVSTMTSGWVLMITVGMIHGSWIRTLPTISYLFAWTLSSLFTSAVSGPTSPARTRLSRSSTM